MTRLGLRCDTRFALRAALLPVEALAAWGGDGGGAAAVAAQRRYLAALLARPEVHEALALASPGLLAEVERWRVKPDDERGRRIERALVKYVLRMAARATPFGLFAGIAGGEVAAAAPTALAIGPSSAHRRRTRVDNDVLYAHAAALLREPAVRAALPLRVNDSLVEVAGRLRYAEARLDGEVRRYHLVAVEPAPYLMTTLARAAGGARGAELAAALHAEDPELEPGAGAAYVDELIDAQILVPELGVAVTGAEPIEAMIAELARAGLDAEAGRLAAIRDALAVLDRGGVGIEPARYEPIRAAIEALPAVEGGRARRRGEARRPHLFQVDLALDATARLGRDVIGEIERGIAVLQRLTEADPPPALARFMRAFRERHEDREVPLAEALDEESGVGFEVARAPGNEGAPLLLDLPLPAGAAAPAAAAGLAATPAASGPAWSRRESWLLARLLAAPDGRELVLSNDDVAALAAARPARLPVALGALVRIARLADGELRVLLPGAGGPSGARTLGRFCHLDAGIAAHVAAHLAAEEAAHPGVTLAEIVHLPDGRTGNVLSRPRLRRHEVRYLGRGAAPPEDTSTIGDLLVSVRGDRIVLRSRRTGGELRPRLTSAHSVHALGLGVYRFLGALQQQDGQSVAWSWGALRDAPFLPRVRHGRVILARAQWGLDEPELRALAAAGGAHAAQLEAIARLRERRALPRYVAVVDGDNELAIDLTHALQVDAMIDLIGGRTRARLIEPFPEPGEHIVTGPDGHHAAELNVTFVRDPDEATAAASSSLPALSLPALSLPAVSLPAVSLPAAASASVPAPWRFAPGSRWMYVKLYGGVATADRVLRDVVTPLCREALAAGVARRWFFVRYADPQPHLRVRLDAGAGPAAALIAHALPRLDALAAPQLADGSLWKIQLDTYDREVDRYGGPDAIDLAEDVFWRDSEAILAALATLDDADAADARWRLGIRGADRLARLLGQDEAARLVLWTTVRDRMWREHGGSARLLERIGDRYRAHQGALVELVDGDGPPPLAAAIAALDARDRSLAPIAAALAAQRPRPELAASLIHMHLNRILHASHRAQELVIYDLLRRHRAAAIARRGRGV